MHFVVLSDTKVSGGVGQCRTRRLGRRGGVIGPHFRHIGKPLQPSRFPGEETAGNDAQKGLRSRYDLEHLFSGLHPDLGLRQKTNEEQA